MKSIRSRVANINEFLPRADRRVHELRERILERIFGTRDRAAHPDARARRRRLAARSHALRDATYGSWSWNYGENPPSNVQRARRFPAGEIDVRLDVQAGSSPACASSATSWAATTWASSRRACAACPTSATPMLAAIGDTDLPQYFGDMAREDVLGLLLPKAPRRPALMRRGAPYDGSVSRMDPS